MIETLQIKLTLFRELRHGSHVEYKFPLQFSFIIHSREWKMEKILPLFSLTNGMKRKQTLCVSYKTEKTPGFLFQAEKIKGSLYQKRLQN